MQLLGGLGGLIFPTRCLGCGFLNDGLCGSCLEMWKLRSYQSLIGKVPVFSALCYNSTARRILLASKEDGIQKADQLLLLALHHAARSALESIGIRPALVPIPSSPKAVRRRARHFMADMSLQIGARETMPVYDILQHNRRVLDQSHLNASDRFKNLGGAISLSSPFNRPRTVLLVDDLMTTGATLSEAVRTLEMGGFNVIAAITAFVALPLG